LNIKKNNYYIFSEILSEDHDTAAGDVEVEDVLAIDLNDTVQKLEAKCAGVCEELGRMALSKQYMQTKQAQLRARKKERIRGRTCTCNCRSQRKRSSSKFFYSFQAKGCAIIGS
jgi:hypothetical protein